MGLIDVREVKVISDHRGEVRPMLRVDDPHFEKFGEIYFSTVKPGMVKGWHLHKTMTLNYAVVVGRVSLMARTDSDTFTCDLWPGFLATIKPGIWNSFACIGDTEAIVANCATHPHDPEEIIRG